MRFGSAQAEIPDVEPEAKIPSDEDEDFEPEHFEEPESQPEIDEVTHGDLERPTASFMDTLLILALIFSQNSGQTSKKNL